MKYIIISGSKHTFIFLPEFSQIQIGCEIYGVEHWKENYKNIGVENNYSEKEIEEYKKYIFMCDESGNK